MMDTVNYWKSFMSDPNDYERLKLYPNINALLEDANIKYSSLVALRSKELSKTYHEFYLDVSRCRKTLIDLGIKMGDHVGLLFKNEYDFVVSFFAVTTLGAVASILPINLPKEALLGLTYKFSLKLLIYSLEIQDEILSLKESKSDLLILDADSLLSCEMAKGIEVSGDTPACIVFTGGTTGAPKGALLSHKNLTRGAFNGCLVVGQVFHLSMVSLIPFTHVFGLVKNLLSCFVCGNSLYMVGEPSGFVKEMSMAQPDVMVLTPALCQLVLDLVKRFGKSIFGKKFTTIIAGGAAVSSQLTLALAKEGIIAYQGYGSTESTNLISGNPESLSIPNSVGHIYPDEEIKIVDGEILVKGDNVFLGYYGDKENTDKVLKDGWLYTGDLGYFDEFNHLFVTGRKGNLIILDSGLKFSPEEIESLVNTSPLVSDSLVYLSKVNNQNEIICEIFLNNAAISLMNVTDPKEEVKRFIFSDVNSKVVNFAQINKVIFREKDFKRSPAMKIIREHN